MKILLATKNGFELKFSKEQWHAWKFGNEQKLIEFYLTHLHKGAFDKEDFNIQAIKKYFGEGEIVLNIPYITVVAQKMNYN